MQEILLNVETKEIRMARLRNGVLQDLTIERKKERQLTGNVYRGRVTNILDNIQSSFIDINESENGFIHMSDIIENRKKFEEMYDMDFELIEAEQKKKSSKAKEKEELDQIMKLNQPVLVQVLKEPIGSKGARLTSKISIAGRYLVLLPNSPHRGVSKKIEDSSDRSKLKKVIRSFEMPNEMGLICRTASRFASVDQLVAEAHDLLATWEEIVAKYHKSKGPCCLYEESDLIKRAVMLAIDKRYDRLLIDNYNVYRKCKAIYKRYADEHSLRLEFYRDKVPMFERFNVEREIDKALKHKIWLPSGGYLFFEHTEAMCTIDVNSGRSTKNEKDLEETLVRINLEAAEEISRQLRIRNLGGLIICDFIDMRLRKNQRRVVDYLKDCMKEDSAKCTVLGMSDFGLIEMTRQRNKESLKQMMSMDCPYCHGVGWIKNYETISIEMERALKKLITVGKQFAIKMVCHPEVGQHLEEIDKSFLIKFAEKLNAHLEFDYDENYHLNEFHFFLNHKWSTVRRIAMQYQDLLNQMNAWFKEGHIPEKSQQIMENFSRQYVNTVVSSGEKEELAVSIFSEFLRLMSQLAKKPFHFEPYHQMITEPYDYYTFGMNFARPLINMEVSEYLGDLNLKRIEEQLKKKENVIFLANHQTEIDPHLINLLLENKHPQLGKDMIFVAGDRVISDHLAIPMSMGRNLLCIYSKKHINNPPERLEEKRLHNKKTMQLMSQLLAEGGKCIYVAPSGGRDRPDAEGNFQVAPYDPQSVEMFYLMTKRAKTPTHFYPLTLLTYRVLPPPNDVEVELGEERFTEYAGVYAAFGEEINMSEFPGHSNYNKVQLRHARCDYIWSQVSADYEKLKKLKDRNETPH